MRQLKASRIAGVFLMLGIQAASAAVEVHRCKVSRSDADEVFRSTKQGKGSSVDPLFMACVAEFLELRERSEDAEWLLLEVVRRASRLGERESADALAALGRFYARAGQTERVVDIWQRIVTKQDANAKSLGLFLLEPAAVELAEANYRRRDFDGSMRLVVLLLHYEAESGTKGLFRETWLPYLLARQGRKAEAVRTFDERIAAAREIAERDGVPLLLADELEALSDFLITIGESEEADAAKQEAERILRQSPPG